MASFQRDDNRVVAGGAQNENGTVQVTEIDATTGRGLVQIINDGATPDTLQTVPAIRDDNFVPVAMGVDENGVLKPILIDATTGYIFADVTVE